MGVTMSTYSGQNIGARKIDRIGQGVKACGIVGIVYSIISLLIIIFFGGWLLLLFVDSGETEIIAAARQYLVTSGAFFIPLAFVNIVRLTIQGMGYSRIAMFAGVFEWWPAVSSARCSCRSSALPRRALRAPSRGSWRISSFSRRISA